VRSCPLDRRRCRSLHCDRQPIIIGAPRQDRQSNSPIVHTLRAVHVRTADGLTIVQINEDRVNGSAAGMPYVVVLRTRKWTPRSFRSTSRWTDALPGRAESTACPPSIKPRSLLLNH